VAQILQHCTLDHLAYLCVVYIVPLMTSPPVFAAKLCQWY